ncbi:alpha/beta fold hydrolase [Massilia sp. DD77]|uniref:alpha/beta fold hydrolase n=1 Tax=Massilia sp. DD77 TaxID=3109349 RepID=UPI002FFFCF78
MLQPIDHHIPAADGSIFARAWEVPAAATAPIVLLHDSLGCVGLWRGFPAALALASGRSVIAYDRLGFGRSSARTGPLPLSFVADEAREGFALVRDYFGLERVALFGHSVGGGMAVHCAATWPQARTALVTEAAQSFIEERTRAGILEAKRQFALPGSLERLARYHGDKAAWVLDAWTETWLAPAFADWSLDAALPGVHCPTLVLHGLEDEYGSRRQPERIAAGVAWPAELELIPGARHVPHREREAWVAQRVARFLGAS